MVVQVCRTNARPTLIFCSSNALPLLILCSSSAPNSNQTRCKFDANSNWLCYFIDFGSNLLRVCNGFTAEVQRRMSRETADLLLTFYWLTAGKSRGLHYKSGEKKYPGIFLYMELPGYNLDLSVGLCQFQIFISIWVDAYIPFDFGRRCTHAYIPGVSGSEEIVQ